MKPAPFEYIRPSTVAEALHSLRAHADDDVKVLAGGQSLIPMMNFRVVQPAIIIDINRLQDLAYIRDRGDDIAVGALTRHATLKSSGMIAEHVPLVAEAYEHVAHATIRNRGTIGGNLAHADAASEMPAVMCALDARFILRTETGERNVMARDFFLGVFTTALEADELLVEVRIPKRASDQSFAFEEMSLRKGDFAMSAVAAQIRMVKGKCVSAVVYLTGVADRPIRVEAADRRLVDSQLSESEIAAAAEAIVTEVDFSGSASVSAAYREELTRALIARALARARGRALEQAS
jgi:carbon-monoxide dehydrogenase medium subunit